MSATELSGIERARRIWELETRERRLRDLAEHALRRASHLDIAYRKVYSERIRLEGYDELRETLLAGTDETAAYTAVRHLREVGIINIDVLCSLSRRELMRVKGIGRVTVAKFESALAACGRSLRLEEGAA